MNDVSSPQVTAFEWDSAKDAANQLKHGVAFATAQKAFLDPRRLVATDLAHSKEEARYFCIGMADAQVMTVRFTWRAGVVRIIGAGHWRAGRKVYEEANPVH